MAGYKETPRQKMIGMMYLVLTALLALNVSKQILDAFLVVNESMETTNANFKKKLDDTYSKFRQQLDMNKDKVKPFWDKAQNAHAMSESLVKYIDSIKYVVIMRTDKLQSLDEARKQNLRQSRRDNYDTPTHFFLGSSQDGSRGEARVLKGRIEKFKADMMNLIDPKLQNTVKLGLDTKGPYTNADNKNINWEVYNFYRTILAATVTILNNLEAEVHNAEFDVVNHLYNQISAQDYKFDVIKAKVIPESKFVFTGETYKAQIIVAAYETKGKMTVGWIPGADTVTAANAGNAKMIEGESGVVNLEIPAGGVGPQRFAGFIKAVDPNGVEQTYPFSSEYIVARRAVSISPTQMLVFYKGVPNPLKVVAPGGGSNMQVDISYGTITKTDTNYTVHIPAMLTGGPTKSVITVSAEYGGKRVVLGSETFRLKNIPEPDISIANVRTPSVPKNVLISNPTIYAMRPPGFDLQANYSVLSFTFITQTAEGNSVTFNGQGKTLTQDMINQIKRARRDQMIMIYDIKVQAPDGIRKLEKNLTYRLN